MNSILKKYMPAMVIGGSVFLILIVIIIAGSRQPGDQPNLNQTPEEELIAPHSPLIGNSTAPVTIVEFSDYQCPACKSIHPLLNKIYKTYPDYIRIAYRHFPLPQHPDAKKASYAAQAAHLQGSFWEYSELLYEAENLNKDNLTRFAEELGLDMEAFRKDSASDEMEEQVNEDIKLATKLRLQGTPTIFLNGREITFNSIDDLESQIQKELGNFISSNKVSELKEIYLKEIREASMATRGAIQSDILYGKLNITYNKDGFKPQRTTSTQHRMVRITNTTDQPITLMQATMIYPVLGKEKLLNPGEFVEFRLSDPRRLVYRVKDTKHEGSIFIYDYEE